MDAPTIGSSDVAAILGLSSWSSPMQVWARLTGLVSRYDKTDTAVTRRGVRMEAALRNWRSEDIGKPINPGPVFGVDPVWTAAAPYEWAHARPDGWYDTTLVECKTVRRFDDAEWGVDGSADIPAYYLAQVIWQMGVARLGGREVAGCDLVAFSPMSEETRTFYVAHDERRFLALLAKIEAWRLKHIIGGEPPPVDGHEATTDILTRIYPGGIERKEIEPTDDDVAAARRLREVKGQIATLEEEASLLGNRLRERIGQSGATAIKGVARWIPTKGRVSLDIKGLEAAEPDTYRRFAKIGASFRTFTLTISDPE